MKEKGTVKEIGLTKKNKEMSGILDYLDWRGDLSFSRDGFNKVDNLIFSVFSYLPFEGIVPEETDEGSITLSEAAERFKEKRNRIESLQHHPLFRQIPKLLFKAASSTRYQDIQLSHYVNQMDYEQFKQFSAIVFSLSNEEHYIAFRGTDDSLIGWKEDFQMSFMDEVQSQKQAVIYINSIFSQLNGKFYLGGHSKGGNLAVYAATRATEEMRERILGIYNNDGPGFQAHVIQSEGYQSILRKINTLIPKSSVIGMLLEHCEEYKVVDSSQTGIMQHDAFTWQVKGAHFIYEEDLTQGSLNFNNAIRAWVDQLSLKQRAQFVDALFEILQATGAKTFGELSKEKLTMANTMIKTYKNMDTVTQAQLKNSIEIFFKESQKALRNSVRFTMGKDISRIFVTKK
ncbi:DUF2974 domain-containing protein [Desulfitobacterium sp.]|uniref:DUF2974 domain-containing protein n=1 Tax=Desulfitobacterium sp. TaxID=49981 RepID=UPI002B207F40|nr:DUF2974 domain-containing protein [Desulfitobacterium sp.]MEA4899996.1 DUF2974 domain-containing protein [Desulfitobacterium sp.]